MFFHIFSKKGEISVEEIAKWILYLSIMIIVGFIVMKLSKRFV